MADKAARRPHRRQLSDVSMASVRNTELSDPAVLQMVKEGVKEKESKMVAVLGSLKSAEKSIELTSCKFSAFDAPKVPKEIAALKSAQITELDLSGNHFEKITFKMAKNLPNLTCVDIGDNHLAAFPKVLCDLKSLKILRLYKNSIGTLPSTIGKLTELVELNLHNNQLANLPKEITKLTNLQELNLAHNPLEKLPVMDGFVKLKRLAAYGLSEMPSFGNLAQLEQVELSRNFFHTAPGFSEKNGAMKELDLSQNQIPELSPSVRHLVHVEALVLFNNSLVSLPNELKDMKRLKRLRLSSNVFTEFPKVLLECKRLQELDLSNNALTELPDEIDELKKLKVLFVSTNKLTKLPPAMLHMRMERVLVARNPLKEADKFTLQVLHHLKQTCHKGFDWQFQTGSERRVEVEGQMLKHVQKGNVSYFEVEESGEVLHPHSVRAFKASAAVAHEQLRRPVSMVLSQPPDNKTRRRRSIGSDNKLAP